MKSLKDYITESQKNDEFEDWLVESISNYITMGRISYDEAEDFNQTMINYLWEFYNNKPKIYRKYSAAVAKDKFYFCQKFDKYEEIREITIGIKNENNYAEFRMARGDSYGWYAQRTSSFKAPSGSIYFIPEEYTKELKRVIIEI